MTRNEIAALVVQSEAVADRMDAVCDILTPNGCVTLTRDEYREHAARYRMLARVAREHHHRMCVGKVSA